MSENNPYECQYAPDYINAPQKDDNALFLAFAGKKLLIRTAQNAFCIPTLRELAGLSPCFQEKIMIGRYAGRTCYAANTAALPALPDGIAPVELMELTLQTGDPELFKLAGTANQLLNWYRTNRFCGCCGQAMQDKPDERARICKGCGNVVYPRISPATITAVIDGDRILLAHNSHFRDGLHSLIAGFVEAGETLEHCVAREIREEVGIRVKNIRYLASQPWPFPDSLMLAFTAEYDGGALAPDNTEITHADWYDKDHLPLIPSTDSIAGKIIRRFCENGLTAKNEPVKASD